MAHWSETGNAERPGAGTAFRRGMERMVGAARRYRWYRATLNELETLSDRELKDIGIKRWKIREAARAAVYGDGRG